MEPTRRSLLGVAGGCALSAMPSIANAARLFEGSAAGQTLDLSGIRYCWAPPGRFTMGSPASEPDRLQDEAQVEVRIARSFWAAKYETTQGQWKRIVGALPGPLTAELPGGDDYPVGNVNFLEAESFCRSLTARARRSGELPPGREVRIPTEAQWEYACRAGTTAATAFGDSLSSRQANFAGPPYNGAEPGPSLNRATSVGSYPANAWGLHDMHGNVYEWCRDWYHFQLPGGAAPDLYPLRGAPNRDGTYSRVRRGGAWPGEGWACRSAFRLRFPPESKYDHIGFRTVIVQV